MKGKIVLTMVLCAWMIGLMIYPASAQIKGPVKIGVVGPHVGPIAWLGEFQKKGVTLAADDINAAGGILGQKVELVFANDAATPATSVASAKKLIHSDKVSAIIGPINSSCAIAVGPVATEAKVPILSNTLSPKVTEAKSPYVLRTRATDEYNFESVIEYLVNDRKYKKFAVIHDQTDFGMSGKEIILAHLSKFNIKPVTIEAVNVEDKDFSGQLLKVKNSGAECMIVNTLSMTVGLMIKQKIQLGMDKIVLAGAMGIENIYLPKSAGAMENPKNIEGVVFSALTPCGSMKDPKTAEFCSRFKTKWGAEPSTAGSEGSDYDGVYMIKAAIEKAKSLDSTEIAKAVKTLNYHGACGTYRFNEQGDSLFTVDVVMFGDKLNVILLKEKKR